MTPWHIIVATFGDRPSSARALRERLLGAWSDQRPLEVTTTPAEDLETADLRRIDAVVLLADTSSAGSSLLPVLTTIEDSGVAILSLLAEPPEGRSCFSYAGALVDTVDRADEVLCARLHGMLHRQQEVARLRNEVSIAQRFHGGLSGEIARMHDELQLAAMVQREFLPRELPSAGGLDFGVLWRPAHYVSGDIYDIPRLDNDHIGVFIADAVGHGVPAALMTMVICRSLTTRTITDSGSRIIEPTSVLARLNHDMIRRQGRTTRFATAAYGVINVRTRRLRFAGAGHPPPLLLAADGSTRTLETSGGLLGVFDDEVYDQIEVDLADGDRLLFYSDGFEQAFPTEKADAYERRIPTTRYREEFEDLARETTPQAMIRTLTRRLDDQQGSLHQLDDLTFICLGVGPPTATGPAMEAAPQATASAAASA